MKIDVCLVTKNNVKTIKGLENIPINKLIIENSKPLGLARMRAIRKVTTDWFAFIDDDVVILPEWFGSLVKFIDDDVGAVQGVLRTWGLGKNVDQRIYLWMLENNKRAKSLNLGERGFTHNTLIRTSFVKDWNPTQEAHYALEDYELTQHILKKGYKWLVIPNFYALHQKTWLGVWRNAVWAFRNWKKISNRGIKDNRKKLSTYLIETILLILSTDVSLEVKTYLFYFRIACIYGMLVTCTRDLWKIR